MARKKAKQRQEVCVCVHTLCIYIYIYIIRIYMHLRTRLSSDVPSMRPFSRHHWRFLRIPARECQTRHCRWPDQGCDLEKITARNKAGLKALPLPSSNLHGVQGTPFTRFISFYSMTRRSTFDTVSPKCQMPRSTCYTNKRAPAMRMSLTLILNTALYDMIRFPLNSHYIAARRAKSGDNITAYA